MRYGLTKKQFGLFFFIHTFIEQHDYSPTQTEMRDALGRANRGAISATLDELRERGWVDWIPHRGRSIMVLPDTTEQFHNQYNPWHDNREHMKRNNNETHE